jgi:hypothetical protein
MAPFPGERGIKKRDLGGIEGSREFKRHLLGTLQEIQAGIQGQQDDFFTSLDFILQGAGFEGHSDAGLILQTSDLLNHHCLTDFAPETNLEAKRRREFHGVFGIKLDSDLRTCIVKATHEKISISIDFIAARTLDITQMDFTPEHQQILAALMILPQELLEKVPEKGLIIGTSDKDYNLFNHVLALPEFLLTGKIENGKTLVIINEADEELQTCVYNQENLSALSPVRLFFLNPTLSWKRADSLHDHYDTMLFRLNGK